MVVSILMHQILVFSRTLVVVLMILILVLVSVVLLIAVSHLAQMLLESDVMVNDIISVIIITIIQFV